MKKRDNDRLTPCEARELLAAFGEGPSAAGHEVTAADQGSDSPASFLGRLGPLPSREPSPDTDRAVLREARQHLAAKSAGASAHPFAFRPALAAAAALALAALLTVRLLFLPLPGPRQEGETSAKAWAWDNGIDTELAQISQSLESVASRLSEDAEASAAGFQNEVITTAEDLLSL